MIRLAAGDSDLSSAFVSNQIAKVDENAQQEPTESAQSFRKEILCLLATNVQTLKRQALDYSRYVRNCDYSREKDQTQKSRREFR